MLLKPFNNQKYFETLMGLDKLFEEGEALLDSVDWEEEGEGEDVFVMEECAQRDLSGCKEERKVTAFRCISMITESIERYP